MALRSTLDSALEIIGPSEVRVSLSRDDPESTREKYIEYIGSAVQSVKIVTGEANGNLFNRPGLRDALKTVLMQSKDTNLQFVFHKYDDLDAAKEAFQFNNNELVELQQSFPKQVQIFWSPIRARQHYAVVDNGKKVILEEPSHKGFSPFWAAVILDENRGKEWANRFDEYVKHCTRLEF